MHRFSLVLLPLLSFVPALASAQTTPPAGSAPAAEPELPTRLRVSKSGFFQPSAQLQFWAYGQSTEVKGEQDFTGGFRLRRAELRIKGEIVPKLFAFNVMV